MAYDLYAFDLFAAPRDRYDFLDWVSRTFRDADGESGGAVYTIRVGIVRFARSTEGGPRRILPWSRAAP